MEHHQITEQDRVKIAAEYEAVMDLFARRHGITAQELADTVRWVRAHRDWMEAMKKAGVISMIGFLASALLLALWEGLKITIRRGP